MLYIMYCHLSEAEICTYHQNMLPSLEKKCNIKDIKINKKIRIKINLMNDKNK